MRKKVVAPVPVRTNGHRARLHVSALGQELRKLAEGYASKGGKLLSRRELDREIAERRGLR